VDNGAPTTKEKATTDENDSQPNDKLDEKGDPLIETKCHSRGSQ